MIDIVGRFMPRVALELSSKLATRVLGFDVFDRYSYEHVASRTSTNRSRQST